MPSYIISMEAVASMKGSIAVEAENEEEAKKKAVSQCDRAYWSNASMQSETVKISRITPFPECFRRG